MSKKKNIILLDKKTCGEMRIPARDFLNPKSSTYKESTLKPKTFNQSYTMLMDLLEGEIVQNTDHAVKLEGVEYRWDWAK